MKMKMSLALVAAAIARCAAAQDSNASTTMATLTSPYPRNSKSIEATVPEFQLSSDRPRDLYANSIGVLAQPGQHIDKRERQRRRDSKIENLLDGSIRKQDTHERSFALLGEKLRTAWAYWTAELTDRLDRNIRQNYLPNACFDPVIRGHADCSRRRTLLVSIIAFLIVFGSLYSLVEYLLLATRASAACSTATVYIPVTYTSTTTVTSAHTSSSSLVSALSGASSSSMSTITSTSIMTSYITVIPATTTTLSALTSSDSAPYYYSVVSGTTSWLNGVSPSSGAQLTTGITSVFVSPVATLSSTLFSTVTIHSTATAVETITAPVYTTTVYSNVSPALTTTSTSVVYETLSLSYAASSGGIASRSSLGTAGLNGSSSAIAAPTSPAVNGTDATTTVTQIYYWGTGTATTSTSTSLLTTTVFVADSTMVTPSSTSFDIVPTTSAVTAAPISGSSTSNLNDNGSSSTTILSTSATRLSLQSLPTNSAASTGLSVASLSFPGVYPNGTSAGAIAGSALSSLIPYSYMTGIVPSRSPYQASSGMIASSNASAVSSILSPGSAVGALTATLATGSLTTVILETTTTTLGLLETLSSKVTVSGWFVFNGTTVIPYPTAPASAATAGPLSGSSHSASPSLSLGPAPYSVTYATSSPLTTSNSRISVAGPLTTSYSASGNAPGFFSVGTLSSSGLMNSSSAASTSSDPAASSSFGASIPGAASEIPVSSSSPATYSSVSGGASTSTIPITSSLVTGSSSLLASAMPSSSTFMTMTLNTSSPASTTPLSSSILVGGLTTSVSSSSTVESVSSALPIESSSQTASTLSGASLVSKAAPVPTACGEHGAFTMTFDDLPNFLPTNANQTDITQAPPVPDPYHHLTFSNGYIYAPAPSEPYAPVSSPHLAVFLANASGMTASTMHPGEIGDGIYESSSAFWFNATSAWLGCDDSGPEDCTMVFSGYTYSSSTQSEILAYTQNVTLNPCPGYTNCTLEQVGFPSSFTGLSGLQIQAFVGNEERMFFMDDLALGWYNNTCAAGLMRQRYQ